MAQIHTQENEVLSDRRKGKHKRFDDVSLVTLCDKISGHEKKLEDVHIVIDNHTLLIENLIALHKKNTETGDKNRVDIKKIDSKTDLMMDSIAPIVTASVEIQKNMDAFGRVFKILLWPISTTKKAVTAMSGVAITFSAWTDKGQAVIKELLK